MNIKEKYDAIMSVRKNMPETFSVFVSQENIQNGICDNVQECAVAKALVEKFGYESYPIVQDIQASVNGVWYRHDGENFISLFDNKQEVQPQTINFIR